MLNLTYNNTEVGSLVYKNELTRLANEAELEMNEHLLPFWCRLQDEGHGGYYGLVDFDLKLDKQADKGGIVAARILWTFSAAYRVTGKSVYLEHAKHAYEFLVEHVIDAEYGGLYWLLDYRGEPKDTRKHVYAQSFGIYALSEYYRATGQAEALELAKQLFELVETTGYDQRSEAYKEEFDRKWQERPNEMLSEKGLLADITTNTHLHILEAYTNLYRVWPDDRLKQALKQLVKTFYDKIYDHDTHFLRVFFNKQWESLIDYDSFGHDIEASWLIDDALKVLGDETPHYVQMVIDIAYNIADAAIADDGSVVNERVNGEVDETRIWWVQSEAIVGFFNAYERTGDEKFAQWAAHTWDYTKRYMIDAREGGEWYSQVEPDGTPTPNRNIADPWKANYHNARGCLELIERMNKR